MTFIRDRVFGSSVSERVKNFFNNLQKGVVDPSVLQQVSDSQHYKDYLGNYTTFSRMWTALQISDGDNKEIKYIVVNDNSEDSYKPNEPLSNSPNRIRQLSGDEGNPRMRPAAGITSINTKTDGALGAIQYTTVEFVVYNFEDFQEIFLPYFLRPGARVVIDYGRTMSNSPELYDLDNLMSGVDDDFSKFYAEVYGERLGDKITKQGWVNNPRHKGLVNTVIGNVKNYDVTRQEGFFQCSLEIVSGNMSLLETEISTDNKLKFIFANQLESTLVSAIQGDSVKQQEEQQEALAQVDNDAQKLLIKKFYENVFNTTAGNFGILSNDHLNLGLYYEDVTANIMEDQEEFLYINYGLFEDLFLNNLLIQKEANTKAHPHDVSFNSIDSLVRYDENLFQRQQAKILEGEPLPLFLYPTGGVDNTVGFGDIGTQKNRSYNLNKMIDMYGEDAVLGESDDYIQILADDKIWLREMFISVPLIIEAFSTKNNLNDALVHIWDNINEDSYYVFNIQMIPNNDGFTNISFHDFNLVPQENFDAVDYDKSNKYRLLEFDVTSGDSIVSNLDMKFSMPKAGLGSMIAIEGMSGDSIYDIRSLDRLNLFKLFDKDRKNKKVVIQPLPVSKSTKTYTKPTITTDYSVIRNYFQNKKDRFSISNSNFDEDLATKVNEVQEESTTTPKPKKVFDDKSEDKMYKAYSLRDKYGKQARVNAVYDGEPNTVAPTLPIELGLSIWGNNFLTIGDIITVNYLPKEYKSRCLFQIVGVENKITPDSWESTYNTLFKVIPEEKKELVNAKDIKITYASDYIENNLNETGVITHDPELPTLPLEIVDGFVKSEGKKYAYTHNFTSPDDGNQLASFANRPKKRRGEVDLTPSGMMIHQFDRPQSFGDLCFAYALTYMILITMGDGNKNKKFKHVDYIYRHISQKPNNTYVTGPRAEYIYAKELGREWFGAIDSMDKYWTEEVLEDDNDFNAFIYNHFKELIDFDYVTKGKVFDSVERQENVLELRINPLDIFSEDALGSILLTGKNAFHRNEADIIESILGNTNSWNKPIEDFNGGDQPAVAPIIKQLYLPYTENEGVIGYYNFSVDSVNGSDIASTLSAYSGFTLTDWMFNNREHSGPPSNSYEVPDSFPKFLTQFIKTFKRLYLSGINIAWGTTGTGGTYGDLLDIIQRGTPEE